MSDADRRCGPALVDRAFAGLSACCGRRRWFPEFVGRRCQGRRVGFEGEGLPPLLVCGRATRRGASYGWSVSGEGVGARGAGRAVAFSLLRVLGGCSVAVRRGSSRRCAGFRGGGCDRVEDGQARCAAVGVDGSRRVVPGRAGGCGPGCRVRCGHADQRSSRAPISGLRHADRRSSGPGWFAADAGRSSGAGRAPAGKVIVPEAARLWRAGRSPGSARCRFPVIWKVTYLMISIDGTLTRNGDSAPMSTGIGVRKDLHSRLDIDRIEKGAP